MIIYHFALFVAPKWDFVAQILTTSEQLKIINARGGVKPNTKTFNQGLVVEYMDRAQGPTVDFSSQNLRGTHTHLAKSH